jgi:hypothetical protein
MGVLALQSARRQVSNSISRPDTIIHLKAVEFLRTYFRLRWGLDGEAEYKSLTEGHRASFPPARNGWSFGMIASASA